MHHHDVAKLYPEMLFRTHCLARASVPLMQAALDEAGGRASDPICGGMHDYLARQGLTDEVRSEALRLAALARTTSRR